MKSVEDLAKEAVEYSRALMGQSTADELIVLKAFSEHFDAEIEGWNMRIAELEDSED